MTILKDNRKGAVFGDDLVADETRKYRYLLWRRWDTAKPSVAFIMLNPSTADETEDDPTIRRCIGFGRKWGFGELLVGNLFALRTPDPDNLYDDFDPVGRDNDEHLQAICDEAEMVLAAWGANGSLDQRGREVAGIIDSQLHALDITKDGHPVHPLYQPKTAEPTPFSYDSPKDE